MTTNVSSPPVLSRAYPIPTGAPTVIQMGSVPIPASIAAIVGAGGSLFIEYTLTPIASLPAFPTGANWTPWDLGTAGTVSTNTFSTLASPVVALRVTATTAAGVVEICG